MLSTSSAGRPGVSTVDNASPGAGVGFHIAEAGARVHGTVWGRPVRLLASVADILTVGAP
jgi:hypothetical protein